MTTYRPLILQSLENFATKTPSKLTLFDQKNQYSFLEVDKLSDQISHYLNSLGVKKGDTVGLCVSRSARIPIFILGIFKAGAVYLPIDPSFPQERIEYIEKDSEAKKILTDNTTAFHVSMEVNVNLDDVWKEILSFPQGQEVDLSLSDLAYMIYTSGSTGRPKGVPIHHQALDNFFHNLQKRIPLTEEDVIFGLTTISFEISLLELLTPIVMGSEVFIVSEDKKTNGFLLKDAINEVRPTLIQATPTTWKMLLRAGWKGESHIKMLSGGEALYREFANELLSKGKGRLWNMYGPTEATIWCSCEEILPNDEAVSLGDPFEGFQYYVLNDHLVPIQKDEHGELFISGVGLTPGYHHRHDLNHDKFLELPEISTSKLYRSGDLVKYLENKKIAFSGRKDHQIKLRGYLIEPEEISHVLQEIPFVTEAAVILQKDDSGIDQLIAYYTIKKEKEPPEENEIKAYIQKKLPHYMIPSKYILLNQIPRTPNQKIDIKKLSNPFQASAEIKTETISYKAEIKRIWEKVLKKDLSEDSHLFKEGGNYISLTKIFIEIKDRFPNLHLSLHKFLEYPTLKHMLDMIDQEGGTRVCENLHEILMHDLSISFSLPPSPCRWINFSNPQHILLTGANSYVGAHVVRELLNTTEAKIFCLMRDPDSKEASKKLYQLWEQELKLKPIEKDRIEIILGDIERPHMGLKSHVYELLAASTDLIVHCGFKNNLILNYEQLRQTNVFGLKNLIDFALYKRIIPFTFFSSYAVFDSVSKETLNKVYYDDSPFPSFEELRNGYGKSKLIGELLLKKAMAIGLPVLILRPGRVFYNLRTKVIDPNDHFTLSLKVFKQLKCYPKNLTGKIHNFGVEALSHLSGLMITNPNSYGKAFNLISEHSLTWEKVFEILNKTDSSIEGLETQEFYKRVDDYLSKHPDDEYTGLCTLYFEDLLNNNFIHTATFCHHDSFLSILKEFQEGIDADSLIKQVMA